MLRSALALAGQTFRRIIGPQTCQMSHRETNNSAYFLFSSSSSTIMNHWSKSFLQPTFGRHLEAQRSLTKFSLQSGKRKSVKAVLKRFYRLDWGIWIHGKCGRNKKLYRKSGNRKRRLRQHVFTNASQSWLLDSMVTRYWRKPKYYVDDPYEPYHRREEFPFTRKRPVFP